MSNISFGNLWERLEDEKALLDSGEDTKSMEAIRAGMNLGKGGNDTEFWENFMNLTGNADALSELLEVPKETVMKWTSKIRQVMDKVKKADAGDSDNDRNELMPSTHEPTAIGSGGGGPEDPDTRPMP